MPIWSIISEIQAIVTNPLFMDTNNWKEKIISYKIVNRLQDTLLFLLVSEHSVPRSLFSKQCTSPSTLHM